MKGCGEGRGVAGQKDGAITREAERVGDRDDGVATPAIAPGDGDGGGFMEEQEQEEEDVAVVAAMHMKVIGRVPSQKKK